jgi:hypothetical protein
MYQNAVSLEDNVQKDQDELNCKPTGSTSTGSPADPFEDLTHSFIRLSNLPSYALDRLSRYEATL